MKKYTKDEKLPRFNSINDMELLDVSEKKLKK